MGVGESKKPGRKALHLLTWRKSGVEMLGVRRGGGDTAVPESGPRASEMTVGQEGGAEAAQLAKKHGSAGGTR